MKKSKVYRTRYSGLEIASLQPTKLIASSEGLGWHGLQLHVGSSSGWDGDDLMVDGHLVVLNLDEVTLPLKTRNESGWITTKLAPRTFWINPEGRPFSMHHAAESYWASCLIDGKFLDKIMGRHYELSPGIGLVDDVLAGLFKALLANLDDRVCCSKRLTDEIIRTFILALATRQGKPAPELSASGGIAPRRLKLLLSWLAQHIEGDLTVDVMAAQVGLSVAHFAREFKHSTGCTPWGYVVLSRLERARELLEAGSSVGAAAQRTGFADASHLARLFKQHFGVSPSAFLKSKNAP